MNTYGLILERRTIRKFFQKEINENILFDCLNAARLAPSSANLQSLEYILITKDLERIFQYIKWAGYLKKGAPAKDEKPAAYIVIISNTKISKDAKYDVGLSAGNIVLTALEKGVASCIVNPPNKKGLAEILNVPENYLVELVIALGYPKQKSFAEKFERDVKYRLDKKGNLHVPKRKLKDILHKEKF